LAYGGITLAVLDRDAAWQFILEVYARPGVADDLLLRQQETGLDIVLYLVFMYATEQLGLRFTESDHAQAADLVRSWRETVIVPLRALRRMLKALPAPEGTGNAKEALRQTIKQAELQAEQTEFQMLCAWLDGRA
jgi:uncharacterized protein (TIGR02444 family)